MAVIVSDELVMNAIDADTFTEDEGEAIIDPTRVRYDVAVPGSRRVAERALTTYARLMRARIARKGQRIEALCGYTSSATIIAAIRFFGNSGWFGEIFFVASGGRGIVRFWSAESPELPAFAKARRR